MVVKRICQAIVRDEKSIFPISLRMHGEYALEDVVLSMPAIVGARGIETTIPISLDEKRYQDFMNLRKCCGRQGKKFGDELPLFVGTGDFAP